MIVQDRFKVVCWKSCEMSYDGAVDDDESLH